MIYVFITDNMNDELMATTKEAIARPNWKVVQEEHDIGHSVRSYDDLEERQSYSPSYGYCSASSHCLGHNVECNLRISRCVSQLALSIEFR